MVGCGCLADVHVARLSAAAQGKGETLRHSAARPIRSQCPKPCPKACTRHASACPQRKEGGLVFTRPKTKKSRNAVPIPPVFIPFLHEHKAGQEQLRAAAGELWQEHAVVFSRSDGRPLDPRADYEEFKELLKEAGIDDRLFVPAPGAAAASAEQQNPKSDTSDLGFQQSPLSDSNRRPTHYKCVALAI